MAQHLHRFHLPEHYHLRLHNMCNDVLQSFICWSINSLVASFT